MILTLNGTVIGKEEKPYEFEGKEGISRKIAVVPDNEITTVLVNIRNEKLFADLKPQQKISLPVQVSVSNEKIKLKA